ncbi:MAG TPA: two-component regulator propeller domain-containing protein, partial [Bacteroidota bacterium]
NGLNRYDPRTKKFHHFVHDSSDPQSLTFNSVGPLAEDASGMVWVGTRRGLNVLNPETGDVQRFMHTPRDSATIPSNLIVTIFRDREDRIWIGTDNGVCTFDEQRRTFVRIPLENAPSRLVHGFGEDHTGRLWMTTSRGLYSLDEKTQEFQNVHRFFEGKDLGFLLPDGKGALWIGSFIGLVEFHPMTGKIRIHAHTGKDPSSPSSNALTTAYRDRSGVLWFGSFNGINRYAPQRIKFKTYRHDESDFGSISENNVRSFCEDHSGSLWIGTMNGLNRFRESTGIFGRYNQVEGGLSSNIVWALREERHGSTSTVWAGTNSHGINEITFSREGKPTFQYHLPGRSIGSLAVDSGGRVWAGDLNGELYSYQPSRRKFKVRETSAKNLVAIFQGRNQDIWTGSLGDGAGRIRFPTGDSKRYRHDPSDTASLSSNHVISFYEDRNGVLWIGTYAGLNKFNAADESFSRYTVIDGLPNDVIYGILGDDKGRLWLSTNKGISRFDPSLGTFRNFDVTDGLQDNEFNQGAAYRARNGTMYFGGISGFSTFHPDSIHDNPYPPPVVVTGFRIFNRPVARDAATKMIGGPIEYAKKISLSYRENVFSFVFAALEFTNPGKNRFAYIMEGFDESWIDAGNTREATYTNLDPGDYVFRVRASNCDGIWNEEGASILIAITPPFWGTWWFRGIVLIGFLSVGPVVYFRRVGILENEKKAQEELSRKLIASQEAERKRIAAELHDSVGQDLLIIKNKILLGLDSKSGRDQTKEFKEAADYVSKSLKDVREISRNLRPVQLDQIGLTAALESVIETVAESAHLTSSVHLDHSDNKLSKDAEIHLFRIVQESLNNIVKHSGASTVSVELECREDVLSVKIADNGTGMEPAEGRRAGGLGLSGMTERARILGGQIVIHSAPGKGTTIRVTVPLEVNNG